MAVYNRTRSVEQLLENTESSPPSFTVHLHPEFWILNNGSKFLYQNQIASLLDDIRGHRIPVDFLELFDLARVPFYDGCMVVELLDYRPQKSKEPPPKAPQKTRVVLHPNPETLWADICSLNQKHGSKWTDVNALEVEAKLLLATSPPLCLDPDPHLTRIVNHVLRVSTPSMPPSLKRKATAMEPEEDGPEKARRERLLAFMAPRDNKLHTPSYRILDTIANYKQRTSDSAPMPAVPSNQFMAARPQSTQPTQPHPQPPAAPPTPAPTVQAHSPTDSIDRKVQKQKKAETPQSSTSFNVAFTRSNGSHTPIPPQPTHQFVNQHPPAHTTPAGTPAMQPQIYASFQAAQEAAKRSATPSQQLQMQHQQQMQMQQFMQYHLQSQQQLQQPQQPQQVQSQQQPQPTQNRPPSQPQQPQAQPQAAQQAQQRYTQSPKPPAPSAPAQSQASPQAYPPQFQPPLPTAHFLQQPPVGVRQPPKQHLANGVQQQGAVQPLHPTNASQAQQQLQQAMLFSQMQQSQQQSQQQIHQQQANLIMQQRMNLVPTQKNGGRATPQIQVQQNQGQAQTPQSVAASPSPARASPVVTNQQLAARGSPMPPKAQIPQQQLGGQQQQQIPQQHTLSAVAAQGMQHRIAFTPQYNPSQLRPTIQGTPTLAAASPRINARPITPAVGDVKPHQQPQAQQQAMQMQMQMQMQGQQPIRGPTPLQQQQQAQQQLQAQHMQNAAAQAQGQDTQSLAQAQQQVQQPAQGGAVHFPQIYGYQQFNGGYWRIPGMMPNGTQVTPQQQQLLQQQRLIQQQQQQQQQQGLGVAQGMMATGQPQQGGQQFANQQTAMQVHQQKLLSIQQQQQQQAVAAQQNMLMMGGGGGQPAQGMVMGKVHTQTPTQMQAMKGKVAPKKGVQAGKKTGAPQR